MISALLNPEAGLKDEMGISEIDGSVAVGDVELEVGLPVGALVWLAAAWVNEVVIPLIDDLSAWRIEDGDIEVAWVATWRVAHQHWHYSVGMG